MLEKIFLLGIGVTNAKEKEILEYILQSLEKPGEKYYIVTPNPEILVYANRHKGFKKILNNARLALCDGIGVIWAGKILGKKFKERMTGVDFVENVCRRVAKQPITVGFLGGGPKIAERTAECLVSKYPGLKVVFTAAEWPESQTDLVSITIPYTLYPIRSIDILFVAFGFPKQEEWMSENLPKIPIRIAIGVGGAFDYISGQVPRAPIWLRQLGFEWLYRLIRQPWRIKRQFVLLEFVYLILKEKLLSML